MDMKLKSLLAMLALTAVAQTVPAQNAFSPKVNGVRSQYQARRAAAQAADNERGFFVVTCSPDVSSAAIANQLADLGGTLRALMGNQLVVDIPLSQLDAVAAIEGVLLIDIPSDGQQKTDITRKVTQANEAHAGKADGQPSLPQAYTGKGVIVGLIDSGYDCTHPMFKDAAGNVRIKGYYQPGTETYRNEGESLADIQAQDPQGVSASLTLTGSFLTKSDVILDTLKVKDMDGSHGTHCASIAAGSIVDYKNGIKKRDDNAGKLGGMAPDAELFLCDATVTDQQKAQYPSMRDYLNTYNKMQCLYAMKHFAAKQGKPLVVSWSSNGHDGLHNGTSTMARYVTNYCKGGNVMALCASNEGKDSMYVYRTINKDKSLKLWFLTEYAASDFDAYLPTGKKVNVDLAFADKNYQIVYQSHIDLNAISDNNYERYLKVEVTNTKETGKQWTATFSQHNAVAEQIAKYIEKGNVELDVSSGTMLDENNQQKTYTYISFSIGKYYPLFGADKKILYYPMLIITPVEEDTEIQGWGDYFSLWANSMDQPDVFKPGSSDHSMGDWCTGGEAVVIGAYVGDNRELTKNEAGEIVLQPAEGVSVGQCAPFSSYGHDFSSEKRAYPDVSAPGFSVYAAVNSFSSESVYGEAEYTGQFKGQDKPRKYQYGLMSGTSMSTPAAAGIIALWVQAAQDKQKTLTNADIKDIIAHSSDTDEYTRHFPLRFGKGKINAYKGLLYVLGLNTSVPELSSRHVRATLIGRTLHIEGNPDVAVTLYNLAGQKVLDTQAVGGIVELPHLSAGVYAVKIGTLGSTLIRL